MKSAFIVTKLRTTDEIDWSSPLQSYLKKLYGDFTNFSTESSLINKLRVDVINSTSKIFHEGDIISHESSNVVTESELVPIKDQHYKYFGQLELLDLRLPINETGVRVKFTWHDAYDSKVIHTQHSLAFEKASVLFNLASILSEMAGLYFINDADFKSSYQYFQYSAGIYKFISDNFLHAPSQELTGPTVNFLTSLQLSQAQEIFLLKLIKEDFSKQSLISKLALATSNHYEQAETSYQNLSFKIGNQTKWTNLIKFKKMFYKSIGYYYYALSIEEKLIGQAIAILKLAVEGFDSLKKVDNQSTIDFKTYQVQAEDKLRLLIKDNDFVYHDLIPTKDSLDITKIIKPLDSVKAISINDHVDINEIIGEDIFEKIIPMSVHEKLSLYSEEKAVILRNEIDKNDTTNIEYESFLEFYGFPKSLNDLKNGVNNKLDSKVLKWNEQINKSKYKDIEFNKQNVNNKRNEILSIIKSLESLLQEEENDYNNKKSQLRNSQDPSSIQSVNLRDEITNTKQSLISALKIDDQINNEISSDLENIRVLQNRQTLEKLFNNETQELNLLDIDDSSNSLLIRDIESIEKNLETLQNFKTERNKIIDDLKKLIHNDDISSVLILNSKKDYTDKEIKKLFDEELKKFEPLTNRLDSLIFKQNQIIKELKKNYERLISSNNQISKNFENIKTFEETFNNFKNYEANYEKSWSFYTNLLNFIYDVRTNVNSFVNDRYQQRERLLASTSSVDPVRERFDNLNLGYSSIPYPQQTTQGYPQRTNYPVPQVPPQVPSQVPLQPALAPRIPPKNIPINSTSSAPTDIYKNPSTFDESMYATYGRLQSNYPYDPSKPYP